MRGKNLRRTSYSSIRVKGDKFPMRRKSMKLVPRMMPNRNWQEL